MARKIDFQIAAVETNVIWKETGQQLTVYFGYQQHIIQLYLIIFILMYTYNYLFPEITFCELPLKIISAILRGTYIMQ